MIEYYREFNEEALHTKNGERVIKPEYRIKMDLIEKKVRLGLTQEEEKWLEEH